MAYAQILNQSDEESVKIRNVTWGILVTSDPRLPDPLGIQIFHDKSIVFVVIREKNKKIFQFRPYSSGGGRIRYFSLCTLKFKYFSFFSIQTPQHIYIIGKVTNRAID